MGVQARAASTKVRGPLLRGPRRVGSPVAAAAGRRAGAGGDPDLVRRALGGRGEASGRREARRRPLGEALGQAPGQASTAGWGAGWALGAGRVQYLGRRSDLGPMVMRKASESGRWVGAGWCWVTGPAASRHDLQAWATALGCQGRPREGGGHGA